MKEISANFDFLGTHHAQLVRLGGLAERYFKDDPNTCLIKLRQFGEVLAQLTAAKSGLLASPEEQLASEAENARAQLYIQLQGLQTTAAQAPPQTMAAIVVQADAAAAEINIDEASTRTLIDTHLRARGWDVDTQTMRYATGTRPTKGQQKTFLGFELKMVEGSFKIFLNRDPRKIVRTAPPPGPSVSA
jgi:hypothetical protein